MTLDSVEAVSPVPSLQTQGTGRAAAQAAAAAAAVKQGRRKAASGSGMPSGGGSRRSGAQGNASNGGAAAASAVAAVVAAEQEPGRAASAGGGSSRQVQRGRLHQQQQQLGRSGQSRKRQDSKQQGGKQDPSQHPEQHPHQQQAPSSSAQQGLPRDLPLVPDLLVAYHVDLATGKGGWRHCLDAAKEAFAQHCGTRTPLPHEPPQRLLLLASSSTHLEALLEQEMMHAQGWGLLQPAAACRFPSLLLQRSPSMGNDVCRRNSYASVFQLVQRQRGLLQRLRGWLARVLGGE
jgi:hypothetical protein